jgi:hypothetical protein
MRPFNTMILTIVAALSICYLFSYGRAVVQIWIWNGSVDLERLDEVSVWFYRERGADGHPASPYRLSRHLSIVDPLDGPNWEVRVPGWIPAIAAFGALAFSTLTIYEKRERDVI